MRQVFYHYILLAAVLTLGWSAACLARDQTLNKDYLDDVSSERDDKSEDVIFVQKPSTNEIDLRSKILPDTLNREFNEKYRQQFGYSEAQQINYNFNRDSYINDIYGFSGTPQQEDVANQNFAQYMARRLLEYHADNYAKSDPSIRPVWEAKERLSSYKVEVQEFRFDLRYSLSGNSADINCYNPYANAKVTLQMDPSAFGPSSVQESILSLSKPINPKLSVESHYYVVDGTVSAIGRRQLTPKLAATFTTSANTNSTGVATPRQTLYLGGLTATF